MLKAMGLYTVPAKITTSGPFAARPTVEPPPGRYKVVVARLFEAICVTWDRQRARWFVACDNGISRQGTERSTCG